VILAKEMRELSRSDGAEELRRAAKEMSFGEELVESADQPLVQPPGRPKSI
jgi:hypothetical protein